MTTQDTTPKTIFLVDDEEVVLSAIEESLATLNCKVACYSDPTRCVEDLKNSAECHLVISDVNMPNMNGIDLLKSIKDLRPLLPLILITGYGNVPLAVKAVKRGAANYIEKPTLRDLISVRLSEPPKEFANVRSRQISSILVMPSFSDERSPAARSIPFTAPMLLPRIIENGELSLG